ncbi:hypothetical protein [Pseudoalteromonas sp. T1lg24]|uniref:hypothetical protein n=1 Tax=Pseudoalteromonas sp. T1lg24 TaxID=2077099 RepID=UPI000CF6408B|nr:hypothetical protein [Pseudoalteromonas sp. T1lg24]
MSSINSFIRENVESIGDYVHLAPDIPEKKLNNATVAMKCESLVNSIIAIQDGTRFGKGDEGFIFTGERMIHHKHGEFMYSDIQKVTFQEETDNSFGIESTKKSLVIQTSSSTHTLKSMHGINEKKLAQFLNQIVTNFSDFKEELQILVLTEMSDEFKKAYLKIIVNMTYEDDKNIDATELSEILLLRTRLQLSDEARNEILDYVSDISEDTKLTSDSLINELRELSDGSQHESIMISLVKDIINTHYSATNNLAKDFDFIIKNKELFELSDEKIDFAFKAVKDGQAILDEKVDDDKIRENASQLASAAAAIGAPIAAVYISGSVVGLSAAGITSGLATLGLGMGMTGGLAVIGAVGFLTYMGVRSVSGVNELDKFKVKQAMLLEALKQTHSTIHEVIGDINHLVNTLNEIMASSEDNREKLILAEKRVARFVAALKKTSVKADVFEHSVNLTKCPSILDHGRFFELSNEPTKKELYHFVMGRYVMDDINEKKPTYKLNTSASTKELEKVAEILSKLGYFDMKKSIHAKASQALSGVFN